MKTYFNHILSKLLKPTANATKHMVLP